MKAFITMRISRRVRVLAPVAAALALAAGPSVASQLIYTPVNPSFGGNPLNGAYLLNKAQAENNHQAPMPDVGDVLSDLGLSSSDLATANNSGDLSQGSSNSPTITIQNPTPGVPITVQQGS